MSPPEDRGKQLDAYHRANASLLALIRGERFGSRSGSGRRRRAQAKLERVRTLLRLLGNPGRHIPIIHVTGTSGKGSTSAAIAAVLTAAGFRVGLRTSPYLQVATEKLQMGPSLIDAVSFEQVARHVLAEGHRRWPASNREEHLGYAEVWSAIAMQWFADRKVDFGIVEVGAGGRFDTTNVVDPLVSIITSVGFDHIASLGPTLADIAWHKAGIIKRGSVAVVGNVPSEAMSVIEAESNVVGARLVRVPAITNLTGLSLGMDGAFQQTNAMTAVCIVEVLRDLGYAIPEAAVQAGLAATRLPGRLERMPGRDSIEVSIDGAHNPDKIAALASEVVRRSGARPLPVVVLGILGTKDAFKIAKGLANAASAIVATRPTVFGKRSHDPSDLAAVLLKTGFSGSIHAVSEPASAVLHAESLAATLGSGVLVTGSMYLAGQARRRWFPDEEIVLQRTSWPSGEQPSSSGAL